LKMLEKCAPLA